MVQKIWQHTLTCLKNKCFINNSNGLHAQLLADGYQEVILYGGCNGKFLLFLKSFKRQPIPLSPVRTQKERYLYGDSEKDGPKIIENCLKNSWKKSLYPKVKCVIG